MGRLTTARKTTDSNAGSLKRASIAPPEELVSVDVLNRVRKKKRQIALGWLKKYVEKYGEVPSQSKWSEIKKNNQEFFGAPCVKSIQNYFTSWTIFQEKGGYEPNGSGGQVLSEDEIQHRKCEALQYLHRYVEKYGEVPTVQSWANACKRDAEFKDAPSSGINRLFNCSWSEFIEIGGHEPFDYSKLSLQGRELADRKENALEYLEMFIIKYSKVPSKSTWEEIRKTDPEFKDALTTTTIMKYFGNWSKFIVAGEHKPFDPNEPRLSDDEIEQRRKNALKYLDMYIEKFGEVPSQSKWSDVKINDDSFKRAPGFSTIRLYFPSWNDFIKAGGHDIFDPSSQKLSDEELKQRKEDALRFLNKYTLKFGEAPTAMNWAEVRKKDNEFKDAPCLGMIQKYFGNWNNFIKAGQYKPYEPDDRRLSDEELDERRACALEYLHRYVEKYGRVPMVKEWYEIRKRDLEFADAPSTIEKYFGRWNAFIEAGGFETQKAYIDEKMKQKMGVLFRRGEHQLAISSILGISPSSVSYNLRKLGIYTAQFVKAHLASISIITSSEINGVKLYDGEGKKRIRGMMLESTVDHLSNPFNVNYIGFPSANFVDYSLVYDEIGVSPEESLAVERERRIANIMRSIVGNFSAIIGGERFEGLNLHEGPLVRAVSENQDMQFNFFSLDFLGGWSPGKQRSIDLLFGNGQVADEAVMFLTLNNSAQERIRLMRGRMHTPAYGTDNQHALATTALKLAAMRNGFMMQELFTTEYQDSNIPMLVIGARFERVEI